MIQYYGAMFHLKPLRVQNPKLNKSPNWKFVCRSTTLYNISECHLRRECSWMKFTSVLVPKFTSVGQVNYATVVRNKWFNESLWKECCTNADFNHCKLLFVHRKYFDSVNNLFKEQTDRFFMWDKTQSTTINKIIHMYLTKLKN